jgi:hypothetical protein
VAARRIPRDGISQAHGRAAAAIAFAAIALPGCIDLRPGPLVSVEGVRLARIGPDAAEVDLLVLVRSRSPETVPLDDFRYSLVVDGRTVFRGRWAALAAVPPGEPMRRTLPAVIPTELLPAAAAGEPLPLRWTVSGSVGWEDPRRLSRILLDLGLPNPRSDFTSRGEEISAAAGS